VPAVWGRRCELALRLVLAYGSVSLCSLLWVMELNWQ